jgi:hypothetical protein
MIVKIQRPLVSNDDDPPALLYNEDRSVSLQVPFIDVAQLFGTFQLKVYVNAAMVGDTLVLGEIVPDQDW